MRHEPLATYLEDDLAGAASAIELLEMLRDQHDGEELGVFAGELLTEVEADRQVLDALARQVGEGSNVPQERHRLARGEAQSAQARKGDRGHLWRVPNAGDPRLGVLGKLALWDALVEIASSDARLTGVDFHALAVRAKARHARVEKQRLVLAHIALRTGPPDVVNPVGPRHGSA